MRALLTRWAEDGVHSALPVVVAESAPLRFREWTPDGPLEADRYGIRRLLGDKRVQRLFRRGCGSLGRIGGGQGFLGARLEGGNLGADGDEVAAGRLAVGPGGR